MLALRSEGWRLLLWGILHLALLRLKFKTFKVAYYVHCHQYFKKTFCRRCFRNEIECSIRL